MSRFEPVKNLEGILSCKICANNKQFLTGNELEVAIVDEKHNVTEYEFNCFHISIKNSVSSYKEKYRIESLLIYILFLTTGLIISE